MLDTNCVFCKIVAGDIPADIVRESDRVIAFKDLNPQAPTHLLLITKDHIESVADITDADGPVLADIMQAATQLAGAEGIADPGWRLVTNVGADGGQTVFHLHFHLLGGRPMTWPPG